ncbi:hypothetical protein KS419_09330 [Bacillus tamaricis]|uniref:Uncharacterized protein n=1 Tax=Evansella tamaricis TaxID=2069301 RepID=A0ABS6JHX2_9BACI|nr:hypothetical protein [Evansella tamaricis]MBU9711938.1 hypothetical protein [Evansella tamaricis]
MKGSGLNATKNNREYLQSMESTVPQRMEEILKNYSDVPQKLICSGENEGLELVTGTFYLEYMDREKVKFGTFIYFKDPDNKWIAKEEHEFIPFAQFTTDDQREIKQKMSLTFDLQ